jgi:hypothetical protein
MALHAEEEWKAYLHLPLNSATHLDASLFCSTSTVKASPLVVVMVTMYSMSSKHISTYTQLVTT